MAEPITATLDGQLYSWTGTHWVEVATHMRASSMMASKLDALVRPQRQAAEQRLSGFQKLLDSALLAKQRGDLPAAERLALRAQEAQPEHEGALSVLCAIWRDQGHPERVISTCDPIDAKTNPALLTAIAAALCDLERWEEALEAIRRARAASKPRSIETTNVNRRIKKARPDLF